METLLIILVGLLFWIASDPLRAAKGVIGVLLFTAAVAFLFWVAGKLGRKLFGPSRSTRRYTQGLCLNCGYDLHGNFIDRCPECGKFM